jgi:hypothetical protein
MLSVPGIPLRGQGNQLSDDCPYRGEWLLQDHLFLFRSDAVSSGSPQFAPGFHRPNGEWCAGFDSTPLANGFGIEIDALFVSNRDGTLKLLAVEDVPVQYGGIAAKRYVFGLGNKISMVTIEATQPSGNA